MCFSHYFQFLSFSKFDSASEDGTEHTEIKGFHSNERKAQNLVKHL